MPGNVLLYACVNVPIALQARPGSALCVDVSPRHGRARGG
jgi:hypothetical protein